VRVWDLTTGQVERIITGVVLHTEPVQAVAVTPDGRGVVSGGADGMLCYWDLATGQVHHSRARHDWHVRAVAVTPDGRRALSGWSDGTLRVYDLATGRPKRILTAHGVGAVAATPDGRSAISDAEDKTLRVWDLATGEIKRVLRGHTDWMSAVAVTHDARLVVSTAYDRTLRIWDLETGASLAVIFLDVLTCVAIVPHTNPLRIIAGDAAGSVYCLRYIEPQ
jgi:WD40 repeat protein